MKRTITTFTTAGWKTDFTKHSVPFDDIISGGPLRDQIPPIDNPKFHDVADTPDYLKDNQPVISLEISGDARAYPLQIMIWHEIVNDVVGGVPVTVTFCPLCNTAIVFDRHVDNHILDFGTSGNLRFSDLVMWDRQTESWWQQIGGEAIVGSLTGKKLTLLPASIVSWAAFRATYPQGKVLSRDTGNPRPYDSPPYSGYDDINSSPFLFFGKTDGRLRPMERVLTISIGDLDVGYPFSALEKQPVVNDTVADQPIVAFFTGGTLSPFPRGFLGSATSGMDVGSTGVFDPVVEGRKLTFEVRENVIVDQETGSAWNILGKAVDGPLAGASLEPIVHANHFWFAWSVFKPDTELRLLGE